MFDIGIKVWDMLMKKFIKGRIKVKIVKVDIIRYVVEFNGINL